MAFLVSTVLALLPFVSSVSLQGVGLRAHDVIYRYMSIRERAYLMALHVSKRHDIQALLSSVQSRRSLLTRTATLDDIWRLNEPEFESAFTNVNIFFVKSSTYRRSSDYEACTRSFIEIIIRDCASPPLWRNLPRALRPKYNQLCTRSHVGNTWFEYMYKKLSLEWELDQSSPMLFSRSQRIESGQQFGMVGYSIIVNLSTFEAVTLNGLHGQIFWLPNSRVVIFVKRNTRDRRKKILIYRADSVNPITFPLSTRKQLVDAIRVSDTNILVKMHSVVKIPLDYHIEVEHLSGLIGQTLWKEGETTRVWRLNRPCCSLIALVTSQLCFIIVVLARQGNRI